MSQVSNWQIPAWFERQFTFSLPLEQFPHLLVRLRGTPARLDDFTSSAPHGALLTRPAEGKWSPQEEIGHLLDMEPLWLTRVDDFLSGAGTLTPADLANRRTFEAGHNARPLKELLAGFRTARLTLISRVAGLPPQDLARTLLHPRLQQPMRLLDHLHFIAEHDDHHLARLWSHTRRD